MEFDLAINEPDNGDSLQRDEYRGDPRHGKGESGSFGSAAARLRERANSTTSAPSSWMPEPGDELVGRFVRIDTRPTAQSKAERIAVLETEDGSHVGVWLFYKVLGIEWDAADPKPGEMVLLERLDDGKRKQDDGPYRRYRVTVDRPGDWQLALGTWNGEKGGAR